MNKRKALNLCLPFGDKKLWFGKSLVIMVEFWTIRDRILDSAEIWSRT